MVSLLGAFTAHAWEWVPSKSVFENVDSRGHLRYHENWGNLTLKEGVSVPLLVVFNSSEEGTSPYLGKGWRFAFLESQAVPLNEREIQATMPDGTKFLFRRKTTDENAIFDGNQNWQGRLSSKNRQFTAWNSSGAKATWFDGRISELVTSGANVQYRYRGETVSTVSVNGSVVLQTKFDESSKEITGFVIEGKKVSLAKDRRPEIQVVAGNRMIGGWSQSLSQVEITNSPPRKYEFAVDPLSLSPVLNISEGKKNVAAFSWEPQTGNILSDGTWKYQVTPLNNKWGDVTIKRVNENGNTQSWSYDAGVSQLDLEKDNSKVKITKFAGGPIKGLLRKIEFTNQSPPEDRTPSPKGDVGPIKFNYDDQGTLLRVVSEKFQLKRISQNQVEFWKDGKVKASITVLPNDYIRWEDAETKDINLLLAANDFGALGKLISLFKK
jgi:hypothetical protein